MVMWGVYFSDRSHDFVNKLWVKRVRIQACAGARILNSILSHQAYKLAVSHYTRV